MAYSHAPYLAPASEPLRAEAQTASRELDSRISDSVHVRLLWPLGAGHVSVSVNDIKTGDAFELLVRDGARALEVFRHPYAYAA